MCSGSSSTDGRASSCTCVKPVHGACCERGAFFARTPHSTATHAAAANDDDGEAIASPFRPSLIGAAAVDVAGTAASGPLGSAAFSVLARASAASKKMPASLVHAAGASTASTVAGAAVVSPRVVAAASRCQLPGRRCSQAARCRLLSRLSAQCRTPMQGRPPPQRRSGASESV